MSSCGPPTRGPGQTEHGSWPSSRSRSRACGSGRARCTSTSVAGTHQLHHGNCGRPDKRTEGREVSGGYFDIEISVKAANKTKQYQLNT